MVRRGLGIAVFFLLSLSGTPLIAAPRSFDIRSVKVEKDGQWRSDPNGHQTQEQCARFHLSADSAMRWFRRAREVTQHDWLERLDWTQCSASGTLPTADGHVYPWELDESGRAEIRLSSTVSVYLSGPELPFSTR
jgi:hypothetical protein